MQGLRSPSRGRFCKLRKKVFPNRGLGLGGAVLPLGGWAGSGRVFWMYDRDDSDAAPSPMFRTDIAYEGHGVRLGQRRLRPEPPKR